MDTTAIDKLIALLREVSPMLLEAGRQSVYAETVRAQIGVTLACVGFIVGLAMSIRAFYSTEEQGDQGIAGTMFLIGVLVAGVSVVFAIAFANSLISYSLAPDYYTIKAIMGLAGKGN